MLLSLTPINLLPADGLAATPALPGHGEGRNPWPAQGDAAGCRLPGGPGHLGKGVLWVLGSNSPKGVAGKYPQTPHSFGYPGFLLIGLDTSERAVDFFHLFGFFFCLFVF